MKKLLLTAAAILATLNIYAQGTGQGVVGFSGIGAPADDRIYVTQDASTPHTSGVAANSAYSYAFFWSLPGQNNWTQIGASANFLDAAAGQLAGGNRTINGLPANGAVVDIQVHAWERAFGTSFDSVLASGNADANLGKSVIVTLKSKDPTVTLETVPSLTGQPGWVGFALTPVPEPSVIGLGLLGAGALLMLRRRK